MHFQPLCVYVAEYVKGTLVKLYSEKATRSAANSAVTSYLAGEEATHADDAEDVEDG